MGDRLLCFQIGNENDQFRAMPEFRDASSNFDAYFKEYRELVVGGAQLRSQGAVCGAGCGYKYGLVAPFRRT